MQLFGAAQRKLVERVVTPVGPADGPSVATCIRCCLKGLKGQAANAGTRRCKGNWSLPASKCSTTSLEGLDSLIPIRGATGFVWSACRWDEMGPVAAWRSRGVPVMTTRTCCQKSTPTLTHICCRRWLETQMEDRSDSPVQRIRMGPSCRWLEGSGAAATPKAEQQVFFSHP
jgi:hypothetical protein